jgi:hypothetical protein
MGGDEKKKSRKHATSDGCGRAHEQNVKKQLIRVAKYNVHRCDSLGVEWQGYSSSPQTTPRLVYRCEALGGTD